MYMLSRVRDSVRVRGSFGVVVELGLGSDPEVDLCVRLRIGVVLGLTITYNSENCIKR